jgi:uncharacterized protein (DUF1697 family)
MPRHIAFLRAVNVGGRTVKMEDLRGLFEQMGYAKVETFIASGNVIFETKSKDGAALEKKIEAALEKALGFEVKTFVRRDAELAAIVAHRAFPAKLLKEAVALNVGFLEAPMSAKDQALLRERFVTDIDEFALHGRELYWLCRKKQSESDFSNALFERVLKLRTTFRGVATLEKIVAKYPPGSM